MTHDEIIEMMLEAELLQYGIHINNLKVFANLVAAKAFQDGYEKGVAAFNEAVELEREACAKVCEDDINSFKGAYYLANKIRVRGKQA
jgi:hypothetical protein